MHHLTFTVITNSNWIRSASLSIEIFTKITQLHSTSTLSFIFTVSNHLPQAIRAILFSFRILITFYIKKIFKLAILRYYTFNRVYYRLCAEGDVRRNSYNKECNEKLFRLCQLFQILDNNLRWIGARSSELRTGRLH